MGGQQLIWIPRHHAKAPGRKPGIFGKRRLNAAPQLPPGEVGWLVPRIVQLDELIVRIATR